VTEDGVKITRVEAIHIEIPMNTPFRSAGRSQTVTDNVLVRIEAEDGSCGWGEAVAAPLMTGETGERMAASVEYLAGRLIGRDPRGVAGVHAELSAAMAHSEPAVSAIDIAMHDLAGRVEGVAVHLLCGGRNRDLLTPGLGINAYPEDAHKAAAAVSTGVQAIKVKVAVADSGHELVALRAIREAIGPDVPLAIDASGGWSSHEALRFLASASELDLSYCEQPVPRHDVAGLRAVVSAGEIPIYADESVTCAADLGDLAELGIAGVSMKLIKMGGITGFMDAARRAASLGMVVNLAGKEAGSSVTAAAYLHMGTALPTSTGAVSLSNHKLVEDLVTNPVGLSGGELRAPDGAGLGIEVDETVVARYERARRVVTG
jgi:muconate cycloisomerase